jgi:hypothetical protein
MSGEISFEDLAAGLRGWARGGTAHEQAAVELLIWHGTWLRRPDFKGACITQLAASEHRSVSKESCEELKISRRTFDRYRALGTGPRCEPIGGHGPLRVRRSWLDDWLVNGPQPALAPQAGGGRSR